MQNASVKDVRAQLVHLGGTLSQEAGLGRIIGQIVVYLYLVRKECSLDTIEQDLGLSKAAVSIAARQLEKLGLLVRVWKKGDRKGYYRTADNLGTALQRGVFSLIMRRVESSTVALDDAYAKLTDESEKDDEDPDLRFLLARVRRAKSLSDNVEGLLSTLAETLS